MSQLLTELAGTTIVWYARDVGVVHTETEGGLAEAMMEGMTSAESETTSAEGEAVSAENGTLSMNAYLIVEGAWHSGEKESHRLHLDDSRCALHSCLYPAEGTR